MRGVFIAALATMLVGPLGLSHAYAQALHRSGRAHYSGQHSCSQSWATSWEEASFSLDVSAQEAATISIERTSNNRMGSQPMFGDGASSPTVIQQHDVVTLTGTAQRSAHSLDLHMTAMTHATARWQGEGTLPLGAPMTRAVTLNIHCDESTVPVYELAEFEHPAEGTRSHAATIYVCQFTDPASAGWNAFLTEYGVRIFPLARTPILRVESDGPFREEPFYRAP